MHVVVMTLYALIVWLSAMAYAAITSEVSITMVALAGPFIISSAILFLTVLDTILCYLSGVIRRRIKARRAA